MFSEKINTSIKEPIFRVSTARTMTASDKLSEADKDFILALYDSQIRFVDENIREILNALRNRDMLKDALVIITADHGEEFWEHNNFEHGHTLYEELIHVPLIIEGTGVKNLEITERVRLIDLLPTVLEFTNVSVSKSGRQGVSLLGLLAGKKKKLDLPVFAMGTLYGDEKYCLIKENMKIVWLSLIHI